MACGPCEARRRQFEEEARAAFEAARQGNFVAAATVSVNAGATALTGLAEMVGLKKKEPTNGA